MPVTIYFLKFAFCNGIKDIQGRNEEKLSRYGLRVIEELVVLCKHIGKHLLCYIPRAGIADKVRAPYAFAGIGEGYVHTNDFVFFPVSVILSHYVMCLRVFFVIFQFNIAEFMASDKFFLHFRRQGAPCIKVVNVFLSKGIGPVNKVRVFISDDPPFYRFFINRVFRAVNEVYNGTAFKITEALSFVD